MFAREGLQGATTRVIAREAEVSEVTLFRLFESKEKLLGEVLAQICGEQSVALASRVEWTNDLRGDLLSYAHAYNDMLVTNEAMIRTLIGEASRQPELARQMIRDSVKPARLRLIAYLEKARSKREVRGDVDLAIIADMFTGMLLAGMLRRTAHGVRDYSATAYIESCVEVVIAGLTPPGGRKS